MCVCVGGGMLDCNGTPAKKEVSRTQVFEKPAFKAAVTVLVTSPFTLGDQTVGIDTPIYIYI